MRKVLILFTALFSLPAIAQEVTTLETVVTFIAGQTVYVSAGIDDGLVADDTLEVYKDGNRLGEMVVISSTLDRAVLGFADAPFPVTMGDHLTLTLTVSVPEQIELPPTPVETDRPSILTQGENETAQRSYSAPHVSGRIQIGVSSLMSSTSTGTSADISRTYATPFALLRTQIDNLPGGLSLNTRARAAYRYADPTPFSEEVDLRVYDLSLEKHFVDIPLKVTAGRFYNTYDRFSGYWDGLKVHVGDRERGIGVAAGFQPDRSNESPTTDFAKYTVFGHAALERGEIRFDGTILGGQIIPQLDSLQTRTFAGIEQRIFAGNFRASAEALVDQDPVTGDWLLSRLGGRVTVTASRGVRLRASAISRRPYLLYGDNQSLLSRSTRVGGGVTVSLQQGPLPGVSIRADVTNAMTEGRPNTLTVGGGVSIPRIPSTGVGLSVNGTVWQHENLGETQRGIYGGAGITRSFGSTYGRLGYRYQQSPLLGTDALVTHGLDAMLQVPLKSGLALTIQASTSFSDRISSTRLYSAIWYRF